MYLGYVIMRDGIKTDPKKVQGIMDPGRPKTTTEARVLINMVQYYRDMWPMRSHILAPLIEASSSSKVERYYGMMIWKSPSRKSRICSTLRTY